MGALLGTPTRGQVPTETRAAPVPGNKRIAVLTVPHARCPNAPVVTVGLMTIRGHQCDTTAAIAAETIANALRMNPKFETVSVLLGDVSRDQCDLNRAACRNSIWRTAVANKVR